MLWLSLKSCERKLSGLDPSLRLRAINSPLEKRVAKKDESWLLRGSDGLLMMWHVCLRRKHGFYRTTPYAMAIEACVEVDDLATCEKVGGSGLTCQQQLLYIVPIARDMMMPPVA